jgi:CYTH domain-containing protein
MKIKSENFEIDCSIQEYKELLDYNIDLLEKISSSKNENITYNIKVDGNTFDPNVVFEELATHFL